jgi:hypothetical protein
MYDHRFEDDVSAKTLTISTGINLIQKVNHSQCVASYGAYQQGGDAANDGTPKPVFISAHTSSLRLVLRMWHALAKVRLPPPYNG